MPHKKTAALFFILLLWNYLSLAGEISSGEILNFVDKGFKIRPPKGFEIDTSGSNITLMLWGPKTIDNIYRSNIQILRLNDAMPIDEQTGDEMSKILVEKYPKLNPAAQDYRVDEYQILELEPDMKAILFTSSFKISNNAMKQLQLLVSSAEEHYLLTFTALAKTWDDLSLINAATDCLYSIRLNSPAPIRYSTLKTLLIVAIIIFVLFNIIILIRRKKATTMYAANSENPYPDMSSGHAESTSGEKSLSSNFNIEVESVGLEPKSTGGRSLAPHSLSSKAKSNFDSRVDEDSEISSKNNSGKWKI